MLVFLFVMIIISFSGCDRKAAGNLVTDGTQVTQEIEETQETEETQVTEEPNNRALSSPTEWSYYVKNETGDRLFNFYYGYKKVIFVFDQDKVVEIRVEIFSSPT